MSVAMPFGLASTVFTGPCNETIDLSTHCLSLRRLLQLFLSAAKLSQPVQRERMRFSNFCNFAKGGCCGSQFPASVRDLDLLLLSLRFTLNGEALAARYCYPRRDRRISPLNSPNTTQSPSQEHITDSRGQVHHASLVAS
jgi:hypothetical protein